MQHPALTLGDELLAEDLGGLQQSSIQPLSLILVPHGGLVRPCEMHPATPCSFRVR